MSGAFSGLRPGQQVGDYTIERALGEGAMGAVYLARLGDLEARHALKVMLLLDRPGAVGAWSRFEREARALARLDHPGVVRVHTFGREGRAGYLAMDFVSGQTLDALIDAETLDERAKIKIGAALARTLAYLHGQGVIHRDLKPSNVIVRDDDGAPVLCDFGLVRAEDDERLTQSQQLVGTPSFMAPEQIAGEHRKHGPPTDVFALGATLYTLFAGEPPFDASDLLTLASQILSKAPDPPPATTPGLSSLILRLLAKRPEDRPSARDVADALEGVLAGERLPEPRNGMRLIVAGGLIGLIALGGVSTVWRASDSREAPVGGSQQSVEPQAVQLEAQRSHATRAISEGRGAAALAAVSSGLALGPAEPGAWRLLEGQARVLLGELETASGLLPAEQHPLIEVERERRALEAEIERTLGLHESWGAIFEAAQRLRSRGKLLKAAEGLEGAVRRRVFETVISVCLSAPRRVFLARQEEILRLLSELERDAPEARVGRWVAIWVGREASEASTDDLQALRAFPREGLGTRWKLDMLALEVLGARTLTLERIEAAFAQPGVAVEDVPIKVWSWLELYLLRSLFNSIGARYRQALNRTFLAGAPDPALWAKALRWTELGEVFSARRARGDTWRVDGERLALAELHLYAREFQRALDLAQRLERPSRSDRVRHAAIVAECQLELGDVDAAAATIQGREGYAVLGLRARIAAARGRPAQVELWLNKASRIKSRGGTYDLPWRRPDLTRRLIAGDDPRLPLEQAR